MNAVAEASTITAPCELPEFIRDYLDVDSATTCSFNPFGTLLAVGTSSGHVHIWEMEMLSPAATLDVGHHRILQIDWSDDGHFVVVLSNSTVTRIELLHSTQKVGLTTGDEDSYAREAPWCDAQREVFMCEHEITAMDLNRNTPHQCILTTPRHITSVLSFRHPHRDLVQLPVLLNDTIGDAGTNGKLHEACGALPMAVFDATGTKILQAYRDGWICTYDAASLKILDIYALPMGCKIIGVKMERHVHILIVHLRGQCPMILQLHPATIASSTVRPITATEGKECIKMHVVSKMIQNAKGGSLRNMGSPWMTLKRWLQHPLSPLNGASWDIGCVISSEGVAKYALASTSHGTASPFGQQHLIHVWNIETGEVERILEGPREAVQHICWHTTCRSAVSVSNKGKVYIWSKRHREYWSVFDSGFQEIRENEEYIESETEFDSNDRAAAIVRQEEERTSMCVSVDEDSEELEVFESPPTSPVAIDGAIKSHPLLHLPVVFSTPMTKTKGEATQEMEASPELKREPDEKEEELELFPMETSTETAPSPLPSTEGKRLKVRLSPSRSIYSSERRRRHRRHN